MINKTFLKFSFGFMAVIVFSFCLLLVAGYYKIENTVRNTASKSE